MGNMPFTGGKSGPMAVKRLKGGGGDVEVLGAPVRDHV